MFIVDTGNTMKNGAKGNTKDLRYPPLRSRYWVFTYNKYDKSSIKVLTQELVYLGAKYIFQEETGENGTRHLQGYIGFKNARNICFQSVMNKTIHWEVCRSRSRSIAYCSKEDTRTGKVFTNIPSEIPIIDVLANKVLKKWQIEILALIKGESDERVINWYWEDTGAVGKTTLCKHICLHNKDAIYVSGSAKDIKFAIAEMKVKPRIVLWDVPRTSEGNLSYEAIESVKNGIFFSAKYESGMLMFNIPHIIVMANFEPKYTKCSMDRWSVVEIKSDITLANMEINPPVSNETTG